ncbi:MAG: hypothetical protein JWM05_2528, partial [Acidimicrobiales bacterium]|nr:hypothetical protein [Acidimicrobiales bacterium]
AGAGRGGNRGRPPTPGRGDSASGPREAGPKSWGSLARRGAARLSEEGITARDGVGAAVPAARSGPEFEPERWERVDEVRREANQAVGRGRSEPKAKRREDTTRPKPGAGPTGGRPRRRTPGGVRAVAENELARALSAPRAARAELKLRDAARAYERERYDEVRQILRPLAEEAPSVAAVRELLGLAYYRLGRWKDAIRELEQFRDLTRSTEQHPVLADCYRALRRWTVVDELWDELREASPAADLVAEGRIVVAGSLADRDRLADAIRLLEKSRRSVKRPQVHHLRQAYTLADLYERSGDVARARELFRWVAMEEPEFADAAERARSVG